MRLRWTLDAADDLQGIYDYLLEARPALAQPIVKKIYNDLLQLKRFPYMGRASIRMGLREWFLHTLPYIATYRVEPEAVTMLRIHLTAQERSPG